MRHVYWLILSLSCCAALLVGSWQLLALSAQGATKPALLLQRATPTAQPAAKAALVTVTVVADSLRAALSQVRHAVSENQAWPSLTGVLFEIGDDGERYAYPAQFNRAGFFEDFFDEKREAIATFWRVMNQHLAMATL